MLMPIDRPRARWEMTAYTNRLPKNARGGPNFISVVLARLAAPTLAGSGETGGIGIGFSRIEAGLFILVATLPRLENSYLPTLAKSFAEFAIPEDRF